jgi:hydroxymethylpyrimidine/phosphomethylpyrimidine kinase
MMQLSDRRAVLIIAGSDSSGGAGLARDLRTLCDFDVPAFCAVTAVTAQSNSRVVAIHHVPPRMVSQQIEAAFATCNVGAVKIGMLGTAETIDAAIPSLPHGSSTPIVLDPVLISSSGGVLLDEAGVHVMRERLLPRITLITPNLPEAAALLNEPVAENESGIIDQGERILRLGPGAVLMKGGHAQGNAATDFLITPMVAPVRLTARRVNASLRGTGCALASAIAAALTLGCSLSDACQRAKFYVLDELCSATHE